MKLNIYSVYDVKTQTYGTPFFQANDRVATRSFERLIMDKNSTVHSHCSDYQLWRIGSFVDSNGPISESDAPYLIKSEPQELVKNGADYLDYIKNQTEFPYAL